MSARAKRDDSDARGGKRDMKDLVSKKRDRTARGVWKIAENAELLSRACARKATTYLDHNGGKMHGNLRGVCGWGFGVRGNVQVGDAFRCFRGTREWGKVYGGERRVRSLKKKEWGRKKWG